LSALTHRSAQTSRNPSEEDPVHRHRLFVPVALALALLAFAGHPGTARAADCRHVDATFYTTDTLRLAQRLKANASPSTSRRCRTRAANFLWAEGIHPGGVTAYAKPT
jgi:hypothetical protein